LLSQFIFILSISAVEFIVLFLIVKLKLLAKHHAYD